MTTDSQLSTNEPKKIKERKTTKTKTKPTTRTGTELEQQTSHGGFSVGRGRGGVGGKGTGKKQHNWQALNRRGEVKNGIGNTELKELICTTHGHELRGGMLEGWGMQGRGGIKERKLGKL